MCEVLPEGEDLHRENEGGGCGFHMGHGRGLELTSPQEKHPRCPSTGDGQADWSLQTTGFGALERKGILMHETTLLSLEKAMLSE